MTIDKDEKKEEIEKNNVGGEAKGKSCKGYLYFTSLHKSKSQSPSCYGLSKTIPYVSRQMAKEMELEASQDSRDLKDFKYACIGYSVYLENKDNKSVEQNKSAELPLCVGLEVLLGKKSENTHAHSRKAEDTHAMTQPRTFKPKNSGEDEFFNRFKRNASLVASGVAKNVNKVANHVKETFDDILHPYRRRP